MDGKGADLRDHAQHIPGDAEVGAVDADLGVEPDLAVARDGRCDVEGHRTCANVLISCGA